MITTRWQVISASGRMWVEISTVCVPPSPLMSWRTERIWFGSSPIVGSSRMISSGSCTSASARPTRWRYPLESWPMIRRLTSVRPHCSITTSARCRDRWRSKPFSRARNFRVLPHAHVLVQRVVLRHITDAAAHLIRLREHIQARHSHGARGRRQVTGKNAHRRALARPIGAEQPDDLAPPDRKRYVRHRGIARVAFGQAGDFDHQIIAHCKPA